MVRRNESCPMWSERSTAYPDLLVPPAASDVRLVASDQSGVHRQDRPLIESVRQLERRLHRIDIADDLRSIAFVPAAQLRQSNRLCTGREVLDHGGGRRLGPQQYGRERGDLAAKLAVEASDLHSGFLTEREHIGWHAQGAVGDERDQSRPIGPRVTATDAR